MPIDFEGILQELFNKGIIIAAVVARRNGEIEYISSNWTVEPDDINQCIKKWLAHSQFTKFQNRKYSLLLNTNEYFSGINFKDRDFLLGAVSPEEDNRYYVIGYAPKGVDGRSAYIDVVKAASKMREGGAYLDADAKMGKYDDEDVAADTVSDSVDSELKQEIDGFLQWIKDSNGLSGYIQYYLDENDPVVLKKLAKSYADFREVFGF